MASRVVSYYNRFPKLAVELPVMSREECRATAQEVVDIARDLVPVLTGALQGTIKVNAVANGYTASAGDPPLVVYAPFVEYGTRFMAAEPYFTPAVEAAAPDFQRRMGSILATYSLGGARTGRFGASFKTAG
jgi:hypothetical protein